MGPVADGWRKEERKKEKRKKELPQMSCGAYRDGH